MNHTIRFLTAVLIRMGAREERINALIYGRFRSSARGFSLLVLEKVFRSLVGILVGAWVVRYLGPTKSGSITFILANVSILTVVATLGLDNIVLRDVCNMEQERGRLLGTVLGLRLVCGVVLTGTMIGLAILIQQNTMDFWLTVILSSVLVCQSFQVFELWFQADCQLEKPVIARLTSLAIISGLRVGAIVSGFGILVFAVLQAADAWVANTINGLLFMHRRPFMLKFDQERVVPLLRESWTYLLSTLAVIIYMRIDQIMLGIMLGKRSVGIFYAAVSLCEVLYFIPTSLNVSLFPVLTRLKNQDPALYQRRLVQYCRASTGYALIVSAAVYLAAPLIVSLLYGSQFTESTTVLRVYAISYVFTASGVAQGIWFINNHRGDILLKKTIAGAVTNVSLNFILIPRFGPVGAAWSTIASQFVATFGSNMVVDRHFSALLFSSSIWNFRRGA